ncbi:MAG TPA: hypothetical protein VFR44_06900 [Actinomycetota bacterium]|nr:hypothetical protein [Actinomycetota bacterium]
MNSTGYAIVAYMGATVLYGLYLLWLLAQERKLGRSGRDAAR